MYNEDLSYSDHYNWQASSFWWLYLVFGANLILLSILIILFPPLVAFLIAGFLLADGVILLAIAFNLWRVKKKYMPTTKKQHTIQVE
jgi:uncharacterized membrane protein